MNETSLTVCGNVCTSPRHVVRDDGLMITSFRIASTLRKFDRDRRQWVDGETTFLTVSCFRALAANVAGSVEKGQRVMVVGRLRVRPWVKGDRSGTNVEIEANSVGHDLSWGTASFTRIARLERVEQPGRAEADLLAAEVEQQHQRELERDFWQRPESGPDEEASVGGRVDERVDGRVDGQVGERVDELTPVAAGRALGGA